MKSSVLYYPSISTSENFVDEHDGYFLSVLCSCTGQAADTREVNFLGATIKK
jgi:hypothetical protein